MSKPYIGVIVVALAVLIAGGAFIAAPRFQGSAAQACARMNEQTERARRLLFQFRENQERASAILAALNRSGVGGEVNVEKLLEEEQNRAAVEAEDARLQELARQGAAEMRELDERYLKALYGNDWEQHRPSARRLGANVSQMTRALTEGLKERDGLLKQNKRLLQDALSATNQALAETEAAGTGAEALAQRLKGVVLYYLGQSRNDEADFLRHDAGRFRAEVGALGARAAADVAEQKLVASSGVEPRIAEAERGVTEAQSRLAEAQAAATALQTRVDERKAKIAATESVANEARAGMEALQLRGVDLTHPQGFQNFAAEFDRLAQTFRDATAELQRLQTGALVNARIDASGDLVKGRYVPVQSDQPVRSDPGLAGLEIDWAQAKLKSTAAEAGLTSARALRDALVAQRADFEQRATRAAARLTETAKTAAASYTEFARLTAEAEQAETAAIEFYRKSAEAFTAAARVARGEAQDAASAIATLSPEAQQRSPRKLVSDDGWMEDQYKLSAADAQISLGRLYYTISEETKQTADVLAALAPELAPRDADAAAWQKKQEDARTAGISILQTAYDAIQRTRGKLGGQWTLAAEAAAAADLLALLGETDLRNIAMATYDAVVTGQEKHPDMQPYIERLSVLRGQ